MDRAKFEVRRSRIAGKGLFAVSDVRGRSKLGELTGEIISQREARRRARGLKAIAIVEFEDGTALDATDSKCIFRYINHSCSPNSYIRRFNRHVEFYALRQISPGEEITSDYGETHHNGTLKCRCQSENCKGRI